MSTLYRKYRPKTFSEISGQAHVIRTLTNSIKNDRIGHAYLLTGPRGTGKTTIARVFAKTINCLDPQALKEKSNIVGIEPCNKCVSCKLVLNNKAIDLVEIDAASHTGVDNIRQLRESIPLPPSALKYKIYIIDEVHMLSIGAFNALLKTLEEPPAHAIFVLATTELHKVPETIISRCQRFDITRLTQAQITERLQQIAKSEKVKIEDEALETIALEAEGGMRDAESLLGQIIALEDQSITAKEVHEILGTSSKKLVIEFAKSLIDNDNASCMSQIDNMQNEGVNLKNFNKLLLLFLRSLLLVKTNPGQEEKVTSSFSKDQFDIADSLAKKIAIVEIVQLIELFQRSIERFKETTIPQLPLEMATIEYYLSKNSESPDSQKVANAVATTIPRQDKPSRIEPAPIPKTGQVADPTQETAQFEQPKVEKIKETNPEKETRIKNVKNVHLETVLEKWSDVLEQVKPHNHSIHAFLKNCTPCGSEDGIIYIKTRYDFYKDKLSEMNNLLTLQRVIATIFDAALKVKFVTENECKNMNFASGDARSKKRNILHDAMQVLGGRIVKK